MADIIVSGNDVEISINQTVNAITASTSSANEITVFPNYTLPTATSEVLGGVKVGTNLSISEGVLSADTQVQYEWKSFIIDGGGSTIETGIKGDMVLPACTIKEVMLLADQTGSIKVDIWKDAYANYPPTDADSICGGNEPEISSGTKDNDSTLMDWTTTVTAEDILRINVDSCTTIERCTVALKVEY